MAPLTPSELEQIALFMKIIRENGGHGDIVIRLRDGVVRYINLGEVSAKMDLRKEVEQR